MPQWLVRWCEVVRAGHVVWQSHSDVAGYTGGGWGTRWYGGGGVIATWPRGDAQGQI